MTVTVVDEAGRLVLCACGDGTGFFTPETSRAKGVAAANFSHLDRGDGRPSTEAFGVLDQRAERARQRDLAAPRRHAHHRPVTRDRGDRLPPGTGEQDHGCAVEGAAALAGGASRDAGYPRGFTQVSDQARQALLL